MISPARLPVGTAGTPSTFVQLFVQPACDQEAPLTAVSVSVGFAAGAAREPRAASENLSIPPAGGIRCPPELRYLSSSYSGLSHAPENTRSESATMHRLERRNRITSTGLIRRYQRRLRARCDEGGHPSCHRRSTELSSSVVRVSAFLVLVEAFTMHIGYRGEGPDGKSQQSQRLYKSYWISPEYSTYTGTNVC